MTTNSSMTHYHKDIVNHQEVWTKTIFSKDYASADYKTDVMWQQKNVVSPETGFVSSKEVHVYIPILTYDIKEEDIIVKGICEQDNPTKITDKFTVTSAIPCDYGNLQHTELVGK